MPVTLNLEVPLGFVETGELRVPRVGEYYLSRGKAFKSEGNLTTNVVILRRKLPRLGVQKHFWFISSDGTVMRDLETRSERDNRRYAYHNYFITEEDAVMASERVKSALEEFSELLYSGE